MDCIVLKSENHRDFYNQKLAKAYTLQFKSAIIQGYIAPTLVEQLDKVAVNHSLLDATGFRWRYRVINAAKVFTPKALQTQIGNHLTEYNRPLDVSDYFPTLYSIHGSILAGRFRDVTKGSAHMTPKIRLDYNKRLVVRNYRYTIQRMVDKEALATIRALFDDFGIEN